jgi:enolase
MTEAQSTAIERVEAFEILDSRGNPTLEVDVLLADGTRGTAGVPSGASTGIHEASELRDGGPRFGGKGVLRAVANAEGELAAAVRGLDAADPASVDAALRAADGTQTLSRLGANAVLGVSLAAAHAAAASRRQPLWAFFAEVFDGTLRMPVPMLNVLNGGAHADNGLDIQEIMLAPAGLPTFGAALRAGAEIYQALKKLLSDRSLSTSVGDEGGFAPVVGSNEAAIELVSEAIALAGYEPGREVLLALDVAASEFHGDSGYTFEGERVTASHLVDLYESWVERYPIYSIEDGLSEDDWGGWSDMTSRMGSAVQLVGDDLFVTNVSRVQRGITEKSGNAVLIKPNQIGTLSDTVACVQTAYAGGFTAVMSHRSGETRDSTIADLAVALGTGQIKTGAPCRSERTAKYNRLLRIEAALVAEQGGPPAYGLPANIAGRALSRTEGSGA